MRAEGQEGVAMLAWQAGEGHRGRRAHPAVYTAGIIALLAGVLTYDLHWHVYVADMTTVIATTTLVHYDHTRCVATRTSTHRGG